MYQFIVLFLTVPFKAFLATLPWHNKCEQAIGKIVRSAKVFIIVMALSFFSGWLMNGLVPISFKVATLYETDHFVFAIQLYYDEITAVFSIVGALLFFLVATFSKYYMHRDEGYKRFFNTILLFATAYNFIILAGNFETLFIGWEIKGICSFILIAFYRNRYLPVKNAFKAVTNYRISDVALMLAGDFKQLVYAIRQDITYKVLDQAVIQDAGGNTIYNLAQQDMVALRAVMRLGFALPNPINRLQGTAANRSPFAVLTA